MKLVRIALASHLYAISVALAFFACTARATDIPQHYVETDGACWIDTGLVAKDSMTVEAWVLVPQQTTQDQVLIGARHDGNNTRFSPIMFYQNNTFEVSFGNWADTKVAAPHSRWIRIKSVYTSSRIEYFVDGRRVYSSISTRTAGTDAVAVRNLLIFAADWNGTKGSLPMAAGTRLAAMKIWRGREFVRD